MLNLMRFSQNEIGDMENINSKITTKKNLKMSFSIKTLGIEIL